MSSEYFQGESREAVFQSSIVQKDVDNQSFNNNVNCAKNLNDTLLTGVECRA